MRDDAIGFFWEDIPQTRSNRQHARPMAEIPATGWVAPRDFPRLDNVRVLGFDTETYDPDLLTKGPGWGRGVGHIVGVSLATYDRGWYFPVRHSVRPEENMDPEQVFRFLRDVLGNPASAKVGANLLYDVGWAKQEGIEVRGQLIDVQFAEALLVEAGETNLDYLGQKYLNAGKETSLLYQWCADSYGGDPTGKQRANIHRAPPSLVGPYAEADAVLPLRVIVKQYAALQAEGLLDVFDMENRLIPLLVAMRWAGASVSIPRAEQVRDELLAQEKKLQQELDAMAGRSVNVNAAASIAKAFDDIGVAYPKTRKGQPSFQKDWLNNHEHPIAQKIVELRGVTKIRSTFIESYILDSNVNGKVYTQFHPLRGDSGGTRSGRLSSSTPNLQNIPSRDKILAPLVRSCFVPDTGDQQWRRYDYSQIEYRFLAHFALGEKSAELRAQYNADPNTDYHESTRQLILREEGIELDRKPTKTINFGLIYGMGAAKLARSIGLSPAEGKKLFQTYHRGVPFAQATMDHYMAQAQKTGVITTILGRRSRFELWEPDDWNRENRVALPFEAARALYGRHIQRAYTHKALNRLLQGSAADMMKKAMLNLYESGIFDVTGVPRLTVHDELDFSDPGGKDEAFAEVKRMMENAIKLHIPVIAEMDVGANWGECT